MPQSALSVDLASLRTLFPALHQEVHGRPLAYLDNAATTQKPLAVIEAEANYYRHDNANVHRGVHTLSQRATDAFEAVRLQLAQFINAPRPATVLWTKGCTEAVNLVASSWGSQNLGPGDTVLLSAMEHHANIVPWQLAAERAGAKVEPIPMDDDGNLSLDELERLLKEKKVKLVGVKHVCNALGTVNPISEIAKLAHAHGAVLMVDGAQALAHVPVDVQALDADFYAMSAHKAYGPTGLGALYACSEILESLPPYQGGGDMIRTVSWEKTTFNDLPNRFEPGTPNIAGVIAFGEALRFLNAYQPHLPESAWHQHEHELLIYGQNRLREIKGLRLVGQATSKVAVISFVMDAAHPHDIGTILDTQGVAIRTGHHCCMPLMRRLNVPATARASLAIYTSQEEMDQLATALNKVSEMFS